MSRGKQKYQNSTAAERATSFRKLEHFSENPTVIERARHTVHAVRHAVPDARKPSRSPRHLQVQVPTSSSLWLLATAMAAPERTKEGLTSTGKPTRSAKASASLGVLSSAHLGCPRRDVSQGPAGKRTAWVWEGGR